MSRKAVFTLDINNYAPEITKLTFPLMEFYADRIGADFHVLRERRFPEWPITCEKLQLYELSEAYNWSIYFDADTLIHPELIDITNFFPRDHCGNFACDMAALRWKYDKYFLRDGRNIGTAGWCIVASDWTRDIWRPCDDLSPEEAIACCTPTVGEKNTGFINAEHLVDDFIMSRNVAKFGLKYTTLLETWKKLGLPEANFFFHKYTISAEQKAQEMRWVIGLEPPPNGSQIVSWNLQKYMVGS